jgi:hypothetical protein
MDLGSCVSARSADPRDCFRTRISRISVSGTHSQRSSVRGLTENADQARRGSARLNAAKNSRSASRSCGRRGCRRRIESSCRSTRISSSFDPDDRKQSIINSNRRQTTKYASDHNTRDLHQTGKPTLPGHCHSDLPDRVFEPHGRNRASVNGWIHELFDSNVSPTRGTQHVCFWSWNRILTLGYSSLSPG